MQPLQVTVDLVTFGEAMLRLSAPEGESLESAAHFEVRVAGAEANVAVTLSRLGFRTVWLSKLPGSSLGRRIAGELARHGVDVSRIVWANGGRVGVYYLELGIGRRATTVLYDRAGSAFTTCDPQEVDWSVVRSARWVHATGITPALGTACHRSLERLLEEARSAGIPVSFDVNYRRSLWTPKQARMVLEPFLHDLHLLIVKAQDARTVFSMEGSAWEIAQQVRMQWRPHSAAVTAGADGAYLADDSGVMHVPALSTHVVDPIGRGDAFTAGVIWGALEGDVRAGLRYGSALAALAQTYRGDIPWCTREDILSVLSGDRNEPRR
jgi:2-dehydro-3-deoxygluconokinase